MPDQVKNSESIQLRQGFDGQEAAADKSSCGGQTEQAANGSQFEFISLTPDKNGRPSLGGRFQF
jgi:hypothetical protein